MDFVTGLPRTQRRHDTIWVIVDRLTKSAHFLSIRKDYSVSRLAEIFQQEIVRLHDTPLAIVSDRDPRFASHFWKGLQKAWGTRLKFSTAFHPQTDGQSERTIQTLEDMLRSCALEWTGNWDDYICLVGERVVEGPEMIEVTNAKVAVAKEKLKEARTRQKSYADKHRRSLEFQPGDHVFLKVKIEHQRASGLLQQLDIPVWKWDEISMDFVTGLPQTQRRHDAIWVVVDRLTKSAHFLFIHKDYTVSRLAKIFQQEIVRLHGTPSAIVSDRDPRFASRFWKGLQKAWGTRLKFSTAFHPQTDGQSECTIQTLEHMLRSCALEWTGNWDDYICLVEFAYNNSWHASIKCAPFEMLYGRKCRAPISWDQVRERVIEGPEMIEVTNAKVVVAKEKLKEARTRQKSYVDKHRRSLEFQPVISRF
nr:retrotransposable element Tf2 [Tanacetum cinerariifolium]